MQSSSLSLFLALSLSLPPSPIPEQAHPAPSAKHFFAIEAPEAKVMPVRWGLQRWCRQVAGLCHHPVSQQIPCRQRFKDRHPSLYLRGTIITRPDLNPGAFPWIPAALCSLPTLPQFQVGLTWGNTFHGLFCVLQSYFQNRVQRSWILLEYDVKTIFSFSWVKKSTVCLCLKLLTKRKRRKSPLEAKRWCWAKHLLWKRKKKSRSGCGLCHSMKVRQRSEDAAGYHPLRA